MQPRTRELIGIWAVALWCGGGFLFLIYGALTQTGVFARVAAWQVAHWGGNNFLLSFLPGFALLSAPVAVLGAWPSSGDRPGVRAAKAALWPPRDGRGRLAPDRVQRRLYVSAKACTWIAAGSMAAGVLGYFAVIHIGNQGAGVPLSTPSLAAITVPGAPLPDYARLDGVTARPESVWVHDYSLRHDRYRDFFIPLTSPDWRPGDPVTVLEEDRTMPKYEPFWSNIANPPGPREGALERGNVPAWMIEAMRRDGVAVTDDPVVLMRKKLDGVVPGADTMMAWFCIWMGLVFGVVMLLVAWQMRRTGRRLALD